MGSVSSFIKNIKLIEEIANIKKPTVVTFEEKEDLFSSAFGAALEKSFYAMGIGIGRGFRESSSVIVS